MMCCIFSMIRISCFFCFLELPARIDVLESLRFCSSCLNFSSKNDVKLDRYLFRICESFKYITPLAFSFELGFGLKSSKLSFGGSVSYSYSLMGKRDILFKRRDTILMVFYDSSMNKLYCCSRLLLAPAVSPSWSRKNSIMKILSSVLLLKL